MILESFDNCLTFTKMQNIMDYSTLTMDLKTICIHTFLGTKATMSFTLAHDSSLKKCKYYAYPFKSLLQYTSSQWEKFS
jgi:hypothetical protein